MSKTTPHFVTVPFVCLSLQFLEGSRPNQKFFEMIQDFRATLEITPLSTTETVGLNMDLQCSIQKVLLQLCKLQHSHFSAHLLPFFKIEPQRICVCVRKRPFNKQGRSGIICRFSILSSEYKGVIKGEKTVAMFIH